MQLLKEKYNENSILIKKLLNMYIIIIYVGCVLATLTMTGFWEPKHGHALK